MEDGREVITIDVIKRDLVKNYLLLLPITPLPFGLFYGIFAFDFSKKVKKWKLKFWKFFI
jgi:hypothetical protein